MRCRHHGGGSGNTDDERAAGAERIVQLPVAALVHVSGSAFPKLVRVLSSVVVRWEFRVRCNNSKALRCPF